MLLAWKSLTNDRRSAAHGQVRLHVFGRGSDAHVAETVVNKDNLSGDGGGQRRGQECCGRANLWIRGIGRRHAGERRVRSFRSDANKRQATSGFHELRCYLG